VIHPAGVLSGIAHIGAPMVGVLLNRLRGPIKKKLGSFARHLSTLRRLPGAQTLLGTGWVLLFNDTLERLGLEKIPSLTVRQWFTRWLKTEEGAVSEGTLERYRQVTRDFLAFLGKRADVRLEAITADDCVRFRDELLAGGGRPGRLTSSSGGS
jgi:hypothetical protein